MLQRELESNLQLKQVLANIAPVKTEHLQGAYLHYCPVYNTVRIQKRGIIGGHKVYLSPSILQRNTEGKRKEAGDIPHAIASRAILSKKRSFFNEHASRSPLFNHGSVWKPGKRMMYNGMKETTMQTTGSKSRPTVFF